MSKSKPEKSATEQTSNIKKQLNAIAKNEPKDKKEIANICAFPPESFNYNKLLGEGAFGKVRKCEYKELVRNPEEDTNTPDLSKDSDEIKAKK